MFKRKVNPDSRITRLQDLLERYKVAEGGMTWAKRDNDPFKIEAYRTLLNALAERINRLVDQINTTRV